MFGLDHILTSPIQFLVTFIALVVSIGVHEFAHVLAAYLQGDMTGKLLGRLTLNPIKHLDPVGTIMIAVIGIGWGKPAPFNPYALRYRRWGPVLVALAGPISNLILVLLSGYTFWLVWPMLESGNLLGLFLAALAMLNAALAVFNLIPIHPLDGSHLIQALLGPTHPVTVTLERYGFMILLALLFLGGGLLGAYLLGGVELIFTALGLRGILGELLQALQV